MKMIPGFLFLLLVLTSCNNKKVPDEIIIEGDVQNIPDGKVYLTEAHKWEVHLDSAICSKGHFIFHIKPDSSFVPYLAAIHFPDSSNLSTQTGSLFFRNYMKYDSLTNAAEGFYVEKGYTSITGDNKAKAHLRIFAAGKETDLLFKYGFYFGSLGSNDSATTQHILEYYKAEIKKHPSSYFFLDRIRNNEYSYSTKQLEEILSLFTKDVQSSSLGDKIRTAIKNRIPSGGTYPNLLLTNSKKERQHIIDTTAKINMLVFWASWCHPCRNEIPLLKNIAREYKGSGLHLVSISIDDDDAKWEQALSEEKMNWPQYIIGKDKLTEVKQQFSCAAIPLVVFTDKSGKEIKKFIGFEEEAQKNYEGVINRYIHRQSTALQFAEHGTTK